MRKMILILAAAALVAGALPAAAGTLAAKEDTTLYKITSAVARGEINYDTGLMYRLFAMWPQGIKHVPAKYLGEYYAEDPYCATPLGLELRDRWPYMRAEVKRQITDVYGGDLFSPHEVDGTKYRNLVGFGVDSSYGGYQVYDYDSPEGNFRIHWVETGPNAIQDTSDLNGNGVPDMIEDYADAYEFAYTQYKDHDWYKHPDANDQKYLPFHDYYPELNYPPDSDYDYGGNNRWDVYLGMFTQSSILGMTTYDPYDFDETYRDDRPAYFMDRNQFADNMSGSGEWLTCAHEFMHGNQAMFDAYESSESGTPHWYWEASAMWGEEECYPNNVGTRERVNGALGGTLKSLDNMGDGGYEAVIFNVFLNDWQERYWKPPDWKSRPDRWIVRDAWRALAKGDEWYTDDPSVNRIAKDAMGYLVKYYHTAGNYLEGREFKDTFEYYTTWNWFTKGRDDGKHYKYGSTYDEVSLANTWNSGEYPVNFEPTSDYYMNHLGHGYYEFNGSFPGGWSHALFSFAGKEDNPDNSKDWGGWIYVTKNGSTWTDLNGAQGQATPVFSPEDKGIIQISNPNQYQTIVAIIDNCSYRGNDLPFQYSFENTNDGTPPNVAAGVVRPQVNPDYLEILIGANEDLFGAQADVYFTSTKGSERNERVSMASESGGKNYVGSFVMDPGDNGSGRVEWETADLGGNIVSGTKNFSAGFLMTGGGTVGDDGASLRVPAGGIGRATLFSIVARDDGAAASGAATSAAAGPASASSAWEQVGDSYEYGPSWARLLRPAEVVLSYEGLNVTREDYLSVYQWTGSGWEDLGGTLDRRNRRVLALTDRLGRFTLGYGELKGSTPTPGKPMAFGLYQSYPNPARMETVIKYTLPSSSAVELVVYDLTGRKVATVVRAAEEAGAHEVRYNLSADGGRPLPAGVYLYRLTAGTDVATKKMVVAR